MNEKKKPTIAELEELLKTDDTVAFQILPNGEIRKADPKELTALGAKVPLTMRDNLGGEYGR